MNIIAQRGTYSFIVEVNGKTVYVDTVDKRYRVYPNAEVLYKGGYWGDPNPSEEQIGIIKDVVKEL